jgi:hypothetical protein
MMKPELCREMLAKRAQADTFFEGLGDRPQLSRTGAFPQRVRTSHFSHSLPVVG